ncbi:MAG TPA: hypothetical protein VMV92_32955 [Streptosporangiaceae bacterium]|nr:hypothetical protein [Streptosporangiaceae bacterium]
MVMGAQQANALSPPDQAFTDRLDRLAPALARHGMATNLLAPPGRVPSLRVVNPAAPALAEDVYAGCCEDGSWWFWWSWAERIAVATDPERAAERIAHVLAAPHAS